MTREDFERIWGRHPAIKAAPAGFKRRLADVAFSRRLSPGQSLCGEAERTGNVWIVSRGVLHATVQSAQGSPVTIGLMPAGEAFGYLNCFGGEEGGLCGALDDAAIMDVTALTAAEVSGIPIARFKAFIQDYPPATETILREIMGRMRALIRLRASSTEPARARVRSVLCFLNDKMGPDIPMTRPTIAMVAGLTTETVSRCLAPLSRRKVIALKRGGVRVLDPEALKAFGNNNG